MTKDDFYHSPQWRAKRKEIRSRDMMMCRHCGKPIKPTKKKSRNGQTYYTYGIVDHIIELTEDNFRDPDISLGDDNLELLCLPCHNTKTFGIKYVKNGVFQFNQRDEIEIPEF